MDVLVFGSGAVGLGIASCLLKSGVKTTLLAGAETISALKKGGLVRTGIFGDFSAGPDTFEAVTDLDQVGGRTFDVVMVCTKSNQTEAAAKEIHRNRQILKRNGVIVHCQNGWGNAEKFIEYFDKGMIYSGRVITGFTRPERNHVDITVHADAVHVGSLFGASLDAVKSLCRSIDQGGLPCVAWKTIGKDLWAKMLYNCALNPLGAILNVPYGKLAEFEYSRQIMDSIIEEVFEVMEAGGFETYWSKAEAYQETFYETLVPATALHQSSTLQDIKAGRKTEIEALTGQVLAIASEYGINADANEMVYRMIRFIEGQSG